MLPKIHMRIVGQHLFRIGAKVPADALGEC
jgi:hypothetical protein